GEGDICAVAIIDGLNPRARSTRHRRTGGDSQRAFTSATDVNSVNEPHHLAITANTQVLTADDVCPDSSEPTADGSGRYGQVSTVVRGEYAKHVGAHHLTTARDTQCTIEAMTTNSNPHITSGHRSRC